MVAEIYAPWLTTQDPVEQMEAFRTRLLDAADQLFRGIARNQELYGAAYAQAKREGKRGQALFERMAAGRGTPEARQDAVLQQMIGMESEELARHAADRIAATFG